MKTLKLAWLCLAIVLIFIIIVLNKFPKLISYDYYYKNLLIKVDIKPKSFDFDKRYDVTKLIKESLGKYGIEGELAPVKTEENGNSIYTYNVKMSLFSDCYFYLVHSSHPENKMLNLENFSVDPEVFFKRYPAKTVVEQKGKLTDHTDHYDYLVKASCSF